MKQYEQLSDPTERDANKSDDSSESNAPLNANDHANDPVEHVKQAGQAALQQTQAQVARERLPRRRVLARGQFLVVAYVIALALALALGFAAHMNSLLPGDLPFTKELQESKSPIVYWLLYNVSWIGFPTQSAIIEVVVLVTLWLLRLRLESLFLLLSLLADLVGGVLKVIVGRHRPTPDLVHVVQRIQQPSFPSGHTLHYTVFYGFLLFIIAVNFRPSWRRTVGIVLCALLILLVGPSRVYLGEHWPTDVFGGYLIGALCLAPLIAGYVWAKAHLIITASPPWIHKAPIALHGEVADAR